MTPNFDSHGFDWPGGPDYEPPPPPRCHCGAFLSWTPDRQEPWERTIECDGTATATEVAPSPELAAIIGDKPYTEWMSACGSTGGEHLPHLEVVDAGVTFIWTCRKGGHEHREG